MKQRMPADLMCNACKYQFEGAEWFVLVDTAQGRDDDWQPDRVPARGNRCPQCKSVQIRVLPE